MPSSAMIKRCIAGTCLTFVLLVSVMYVTLFNRRPADDILIANRHLSRRMSNFGGEMLHDPDFERKPIEEMTPSEYSHAKWNAWIEVNEYVSIGKIYNKCDGDHRIMTGRVVMLPDPKRGGLKSRTFYNVTFDHDITTGDMYIEVRYNGRELYGNHWELCTVETDREDRTINCPLTKGKHKFIKDVRIPNYLPKGRYEVKAWATDQDDQPVGCAYSDFTL